MKTRCKTYTSEQISKFVDKELPKNEYDILESHLHQCSACSHLVEQYNTLSVLFTSHIDQQVKDIDTSQLNQNRVSQKLNKVIKNATRNVKWNVFGSFKSSFFELFTQNIYLKLASITAILMISLFSFQTTWFGTPGPSAIVNSVNTDFASVMIIETQKEKHTIIWFSETG
jgi:putative zinc finger protein